MVQNFYHYLTRLVYVRVCEYTMCALHFQPNFLRTESMIELLTNLNPLFLFFLRKVLILYCNQHFSE